MKRIYNYVAVFAAVLVSFAGVSQTSTVYLTVSGGSFAGEKWVSITDGPNGTGNVIWDQDAGQGGGGTYGAGSGFLTDEPITINDGQTYYINCYDSYDDGWDGTTYALTDAVGGGTIIANNGGLVPNDGNDTDVTGGVFEAPGTDELEVSEMFSYTPPSCSSPSALTAANVTGSSADLGWTENGTATNWQIEYDVTGFTQGTGNMSVTGNNPTNVTGLMASTDYDFYVRAICAPGDTSGWAGPFSFATQCVPLTVFPYTEDFESGASGWSFAGANSSWAIGSPNGTTINAAANGTNAAVTNLSGNYNANEVSFLITPCFDFTTLTYPVISFNQIRDLENCCDETWVEYTLDEITWTKLGVTPVWDSNPHNDTGNDWWDSDNLTWTSTSIAMPSLAGEGLVKFRFVMSSDFSAQQAGVGVDDFSIVNVSCPAPTNLIATVVDNDSLVVTWDVGFTEVDWNIELGMPGFTPGTSTEMYSNAISTTPTDTIGGLVQLTDYDVYVQSDCGADSSLWLGPLSVTTIANCPDVSAITVDAQVSDSVFFSWTSNGSEVLWDVQYGPVGFDPLAGMGMMISSSATNDTITGLVSNEAIDIYVRSDCGGTDQGIWIGPITFTMPCIDIMPITLPYIQDF